MADAPENTLAKTYYLDKSHPLNSEDVIENIRQMLFAPMFNTLGQSIETFLLSEGRKLAREILDFQDEWREKVRKKVKKIKRLEKQLAEKSKEGSGRERGDDSRRSSGDDGQTANGIFRVRAGREEDEKDRLIQELRLKLSQKDRADLTLQALTRRDIEERDKTIKKLREELTTLKEEPEKSTDGAVRQDEGGDQAGNKTDLVQQGNKKDGFLQGLLSAAAAVRREDVQTIKKLKGELAALKEKAGKSTDGAASQEEAATSAEKTIEDLRALLRKQEDAEVLLREDSRRTTEERDKTIKELQSELRAMKEIWRPEANRQIAELQAELALLKARRDAGPDDQIRQLEKRCTKLMQLKDEQETLYEVGLAEKDAKISEQAEELSKRPTPDDLRRSEGMVEDLLVQARELEADRTARKNELKKLQDIVLQHAQQAQQEEPYDDYRHKRNFVEISSKIEHLVRGRLNINKCNSGWKEFGEIKNAEIRPSFLMAEIADAIARTYFAPDCPKVFGFESRVDVSLGALEARLEEKAEDEGARSKVVKWRTFTLELIRSLGPTQVTVHRDLEEELVEKLRPLVKEGDGQVAMLEDAVRKLCKAAFQAALAVRACAIEYSWPQLSSLSSLEAYDVKRANGEELSIVDWEEDNIPTRIVFAPLYKNVGGEHGLIMIGSGEAMRGR